MPKHIFVTGGVASSLGKGLTASSLGRLLKLRGLKVTMQKLDPYINVDPGTMSPYQHGEVFVTEDGAETDLDLGHYERFIDENLTRASNVTTGAIYDAVRPLPRELATPPVTKMCFGMALTLRFRRTDNGIASYRGIRRARGCSADSAKSEHQLQPVVDSGWCRRKQQGGQTGPGGTRVRRRIVAHHHGVGRVQAHVLQRRGEDGGIRLHAAHLPRQAVLVDEAAKLVMVEDRPNVPPGVGHHPDRDT